MLRNRCGLYCQFIEEISRTLCSYIMLESFDGGVVMNFAILTLNCEYTEYEAVLDVTLFCVVVTSSK